MSETILVVDNKDRVAAKLREALSDGSFTIDSVTDTRSAKQFLIQSEVALVMIDVDLSDGDRAGLTLCKQLREHDRFSDIPVILLSESLGDELIKQASECGAQGLVGWPFSVDSIKKRLLGLLSQKAMTQAPAKTAAPAKAAVQNTAPAVTAAMPSQATSEAAPSVEDKLKRAQHLLAMVLHNLKTSNLLDLVELEDIPGIVLQMTRNVCGDGSASGKQSAQATAQKPSAKESNEVSLDLDSVFGIKK